MNETRATMAAQVAHDIRSPLAALGSAAKDPGVPQEQRKLMEAAVSRMQGIADDLLARYRAPGAAPAAVEPCALAVLIEQVLAEKRLQHKDKAGVSIEFNDTAAGIKAAVDPKELQRIVSNLVNNSVEALAGPGSVTVKLASESGKVVLEIRDTGKGIAPEILARLGQKGETHGKAGGTGLGLYHARATAESWGGKLSIASSPGEGTSVTITLPAAGSAVPEPKAAAGVSVLVDDDALVRMNWKAAARAKCMELRVFASAAELEAAGDIPLDASIYIDSELGAGVKGEDLAARLKERGYSDLTLETGHPAANFAHFPWLKVAGKEPPWR